MMMDWRRQSRFWVQESALLESSEVGPDKDADKAKKERDRYLDDVCRLNTEIRPQEAVFPEANEKSATSASSSTTRESSASLDPPEIEVPARA